MSGANLLIGNLTGGTSFGSRQALFRTVAAITQGFGVTLPRGGEYQSLVSTVDRCLEVTVQAHLVHHGKVSIEDVQELGIFVQNKGEITLPFLDSLGRVGHVVNDLQGFKRSAPEESSTGLWVKVPGPTPTSQHASLGLAESAGAPSFHFWGTTDDFKSQLSGTKRTARSEDKKPSPVDRIKRAMEHFLVPMTDKQKMQFAATNNKLRKAPPPLRHYLGFNHLGDVDFYIEQGFDPLIVIHNTGAGPDQLEQLIRGQGKGYFPADIAPRISVPPESYGHKLEVFALRRSVPYLTLELILPASHVISMIVDSGLDYGELLDSGKIASIPAPLMRPLILAAHRYGSARILALPGIKDYYSDDVLEPLTKTLKEEGLPASTIVTAEGPSFMAIRLIHKPGENDATSVWASTLNREANAAREEFINGWVDLIVEKLEGTNVSLLELKRGNIESMARREGILEPEHDVRDEIAKRAFARLND